MNTDPYTFDDILPRIRVVFDRHQTLVTAFKWLVINRDLFGRIRFILPGNTSDRQIEEAKQIYHEVHACIPKHSFGDPDKAFLREEELEDAKREASFFPLSEDFQNVHVVDRLATSDRWDSISPESKGVPRIVFFSIKGGVGRSTALAATAWSLAQSGKRVLVIDLDLASPGLSSNLLPDGKRPKYGVTDWLVEDLVDNGDTLLRDMVTTSDLSHDGEIYVVPAHGAELGDYIAKLGRVWVSKQVWQSTTELTIEHWPKRLRRMVNALEQEKRPDVILIDSRSGIDEIASACITELGATSILLFAFDTNQDWMGYDILFSYWQRMGVIEKIRLKLQCVAAMVPPEGRAKYLESLRDNAYNSFMTIYDDAEPVFIAYEDDNDTPILDEPWNFDIADSSAPHSPIPVSWNRGFSGLRSLHRHLTTIEPVEIQSIFGKLVDLVCRDWIIHTKFGGNADG